MGSTQSEHNKRLITLSVITLRGFHCIDDHLSGRQKEVDYMTWKKKAIVTVKT